MIQIDMEMPKSCKECSLSHIIVNGNYCYSSCSTGRPDWCQLHEVTADPDTISRKQASDALKHDATVLGITPYDSGYTPFDAILTLHTLPPSPSRPKGQWIPCTKNGLPLSEIAYRDGQKWYGYKCSNCNFIYKGNALTESPYCKKCGADMRQNGGAV